MKIPYLHGATPCKTEIFRDDVYKNVGAWSCMDCEYFVSKDELKMFVICNKNGWEKIII